MKLTEQELFETIYHASYKTLSKFVYFKTSQLADAEDIVQNVYIHYYHSVIKQNKIIDNPLAYLMEMAKNECALYYKDKSNQNDYLSESDLDILENIPSDTDLALETIDKFTIEEIYAKVKTLSELDQKIIGGRFRYELTFAEIADLCELSENTIKTRYYRALNLLRKKLELKNI